jgi:hypothetical protein
MTETDRQAIRLALTAPFVQASDFDKAIAILDADKLEYDSIEISPNTLANLHAMNTANKRIIDRLRADLRDALQDAAGYKARAERADEDCRMMQDRLQRLIDKPTEVGGKAMQGIAPCPFCGGKAYSMASPGVMWIQCGHCKAETRGAADLAGAIAIWNRRTKSDADKPGIPDECDLCDDGNAGKCREVHRDCPKNKPTRYWQHDETGNCATSPVELSRYREISAEQYYRHELKPTDAKANLISGRKLGQLLELIDKLCRLGNGEFDGNSTGNVIAQEAREILMSADKPTVPLAMLEEIYEANVDDEHEYGDPSLRAIAARHGYEVTE